MMLTFHLPQHRIQALAQYQDSHPSSQLNATESKVVQTVAEKNIFKKMTLQEKTDQLNSLLTRFGLENDDIHSGLPAYKSEKEPGIYSLTLSQLKDEVNELIELFEELKPLTISEDDIKKDQETKEVKAGVILNYPKKLLLNFITEKMKILKPLITEKEREEKERIGKQDISPQNKFSSIEEKKNAHLKVIKEITTRNPDVSAMNSIGLANELAELKTLQTQLVMTKLSYDETQRIPENKEDQKTLREHIKSNKEYASDLADQQRVYTRTLAKLEKDLNKKISQIERNLKAHDNATSRLKTISINS